MAKDPAVSLQAPVCGLNSLCLSSPAAALLHTGELGRELSFVFLPLTPLLTGLFFFALQPLFQS